MENYLVSELFSHKLEKPEKKELELTTLEQGPKSIRGSTPSTFYNEIFHSDDEVLDTNRMTSCCNREKAWLSLMLRRGRNLCAQELNITRFVTAARCNTIAQDLLSSKAID